MGNLVISIFQKQLKIATFYKLVFYKILEKYMDLKNPHLGLYA
jgi:hypothetical protein